MAKFEGITISEENYNTLMSEESFRAAVLSESQEKIFALNGKQALFAAKMIEKKNEIKYLVDFESNTKVVEEKLKKYKFLFSDQDYNDLLFKFIGELNKRLENKDVNPVNKGDEFEHLDLYAFVKLCNNNNTFLADHDPIEIINDITKTKKKFNDFDYTWHVNDILNDIILEVKDGCFTENTDKEKFLYFAEAFAAGTVLMFAYGYLSVPVRDKISTIKEYISEYMVLDKQFYNLPNMPIILRMIEDMADDSDKILLDIYDSEPKENVDDSENNKDESKEHEPYASDND